MQAYMSKAHKWNAADAVTMLRMVGTFGLALLNPGTLWFLRFIQSPVFRMYWTDGLRGKQEQKVILGQNWTA